MCKVLEPVPVIVFDRDGEPYVFRSLHEAQGELEAIDVVDGEYEAFALDGRYVRASGDERRGEVYFELTDRDEIDRLRALVVQAHARLGLASDPQDLVAVANELLAKEWRERWPQWPPWLYRRTHRGTPPQIDSAN